jgi:hypothetical protein
MLGTEAARRPRGIGGGHVEILQGPAVLEWLREVLAERFE